MRLASQPGSQSSTHDRVAERANFEFGVSMKPPTHAGAGGLTPPLSWAAHTPDSTVDSSSWAFLLYVIPRCVTRRALRVNTSNAPRHHRAAPHSTLRRCPPSDNFRKGLALNPPPLPPRPSSTAAWRGARVQRCAGRRRRGALGLSKPLFVSHWLRQSLAQQSVRLPDRCRAQGEHH